MTIRDYLKQQLRRTMLIAFGAWLLMVALVFAAKNASPIFVLMALLIFMGAIIWQFFAVRCPRCKGKMGMFATTLIGSSYMSRPINFCPFCGVGLDESYHP